MTVSSTISNPKDRMVQEPKLELRPRPSSNAVMFGTGVNRGLLRVEEAAEWLGLGRTKTYELVARGELGSVCIGRSRRVPVSALQTFVERLENERPA